MIDVARRQIADVLRWVAGKVDQPRPIVVSVHLDGQRLMDATALRPPRHPMRRHR